MPTEFRLPPPPQARPPHRHKVWLWVLGGVAAVVVAGVIVAQVNASEDTPDGPSHPVDKHLDLATGTPSLIPTPSPTPTTDGGTEAAARPLDEEKVLAMLEDYLAFYNAGDDYEQASAYLSSTLEDQCDGPLGLASALGQNHQIEQIDYEVTRVQAWGPDDPQMADVTTLEFYGGGSHRLVLGLPFSFEVGEWKLPDYYPIGVGAFC